MKKFTNIFLENKDNYNDVITKGVTNHYTPIENILVNIKNLYCVHLGIVAMIGEDSKSIKLTSSRFASKEDVDRILTEPIYKNLTLYQYITSQGLDGIKYVDLGKCFVVYFYPSDVVGTSIQQTESLCNEMVEYKIDECEMQTLRIYEDEDEEITDELSRDKVLEIIKMKDRVKAARLLAAILNDKIELPSDYYFAGVKAKDGKESIGLRWRYVKRAPFNKSIECVKTIMNIFDNPQEGNVWIGDFDEEGYFKLPSETTILIESILKLLNAEATEDKCVYTISDGSEKLDKKDKSEEDSSDDKDNKDDKESSSDDKDNNLLGDESDDKDNKDDSKNLLA